MGKAVFCIDSMEENVGRGEHCKDFNSLHLHHFKVENVKYCVTQISLGMKVNITELSGSDPNLFEDIHIYAVL